MDSYKIIELIGRGNYGDVYVCKDNSNKYYVMKKICLINHSKEEKKNIENEVMVLKKLKHLNIVNYIDSFYDDYNKNFIIIMEYCKDGDLYKKIREKEGKLISESIILKWIAHLCLGIHYLHGVKILHRDLKTQNIFLNNNRLILGDFGISKILNSTHEFAHTYIGTPYYMSPELFDNKPYSYKSDIWSLGCIIYEMCTQKNPFNAQSIQILGLNIQKGVYPPINSFYSNNLKELLKSLLNTNPKMRPNIKQIINKEFIKKEVINHILDIIYNNNEFPIDTKNNLRTQLVKLGLMDIIKSKINEETFNNFFNLKKNKVENKINFLLNLREHKQYELSNMKDMNNQYKHSITYLRKKLNEDLISKKSSKMQLYKDIKLYKEEYKDDYINNNILDEELDLNSDLEEIKEEDNDFDDENDKEKHEEIKIKIKKYEKLCNKNEKKINNLEITIKETTIILNNTNNDNFNDSKIFNELTSEEESSHNSYKELESPFFISEIEKNSPKNINKDNLFIVNKLQDKYKKLE